MEKAIVNHRLLYGGNPDCNLLIESRVERRELLQQTLYHRSPSFAFRAPSTMQFPVDSFNISGVKLIDVRINKIIKISLYLLACFVRFQNQIKQLFSRKGVQGFLS